MGDRQEKQFLLGQAVWKGHPERRIQQREQQSLQPQFVQVLWCVITPIFFLLFFFEKKLDFVLIVENGYRLILLMILSQNI